MRHQCGQHYIFTVTYGVQAFYCCLQALDSLPRVSHGRVEVREFCSARRYPSKCAQFLKFGNSLFFSTNRYFIKVEKRCQFRICKQTKLG